MATASKKSVKKPDAKPTPAKKPAVKTAAPAKKATPTKKAATPAKKTTPAKPAAPVKKAATPVAKTPAKKVSAKPAAPAPAKKAAPKPVATKVAARPAPAKPSPKPVAAPARPKATATKVASKQMPATSKTASKTKAAKATAAPVGVITEAELLKMSEKDYMNPVQLEFFRNRLLTMREEILLNARETGEHLKENEMFADPNDRATVEEENMLEQRVRDRERKLLKKIDASLRRIEEGEYGYCLETGEPIGVPRLLARPTAELSIEAQEKHERLEKLFAD